MANDKRLFVEFSQITGNIGSAGAAQCTKDPECKDCDNPDPKAFATSGSPVTVDGHTYSLTVEEKLWTLPAGSTIGNSYCVSNPVCCDNTVAASPVLTVRYTEIFIPTYTATIPTCAVEDCSALCATDVSSGDCCIPEHTYPGTIYALIYNIVEPNCGPYRTYYVVPMVSIPQPDPGGFVGWKGIWIPFDCPGGQNYFCGLLIDLLLCRSFQSPFGWTVESGSYTSGFWTGGSCGVGVRRFTSPSGDISLCEGGGGVQTFNPDCIDPILFTGTLSMTWSSSPPDPGCDLRCCFLANGMKFDYTIFE